MTPLPPAIEPGNPKTDPQEGNYEPLPASVEESIVKDARALQDLYIEQLTSKWEATVRHVRLYLGDRPDPRSEDEKNWRANIHVPEPFKNTEAKVAVQTDIMNGINPPIQVEGIGGEDAGGSNIEKMLAHFMRKNHWRKKLPGFLRLVGIQGTEFFKLRYGQRASIFDYMPSQSEVDAFQEALMRATVAGATQPVPSPVSDPAGFAVWRDTINKSGRLKQGPVPEPPFAGKRLVRKYRGPTMDRISTFDLWTDPAVDEIQDQEAVFHRLVRSERWWTYMAGPEAWQPFDGEKVRQALEDSPRRKDYGERFTTHQDQIYQIMGHSRSNMPDPLNDRLQEGFECFFGGEPLGEYPYAVILNGVIINKNPRMMPYMHGQVPIFAVRNLSLPGFQHGFSDYQQLESIFGELDTFRNLRQDGATLAIMPILKKLSSLAMPELLRKIAPGMVVPVSRMDAIDKLFDIKMPEAAYREPAEMVRDIQSVMSTNESVQGAQASIGRVPATETQMRFNQAVARLKLAVSQIEEDMGDVPYQALALFYQYTPEDLRLRIGGAGDPYLGVSKREMLEAMDQDYRFLGATNAINREQMARNLMEFGKTYGENLTPPEIRVIMEDVLATLGTRRAKEIVSESGTADATQAYQIKKEQAIAAAAMAKQQMQMQQQTVPGAVPDATMKAVEAGGGAAGASSGAAPAGGNGAPPTA